MKGSNGGSQDELFPTAKDICGAASVVPLDSEPPPKLIVDDPLPEPLAFGRVVIQYRTENMKMVPVYGTPALNISPRVGHIHVTVDNASWHWLDASGEPVTMNGFTPGEHNVLIELSDPTHKIIEHKIISFVIPHKS